jgi:hypothetical protein
VRKFLDRFASLIATDQVVQVRHFDFRGHVYDLQSEMYGLYTVNGILNSNCRCALMPVIPDEGIEPEPGPEEITAAVRERFTQSEQAKAFASTQAAADAELGPMRAQIKQMSKDLERLYAEQHPDRLTVGDQLYEAQEQLKVREEFYNQALEQLRPAMLELLRAHLPTGATIPISYSFSGQEENLARLRDGVLAFKSFVPETVLDSSTTIKTRTEQGSYRPAFDVELGEMRVYTRTGKSAVIHELGHALELHNPEINRRALEFLAERTAGEQAEWLGDEYNQAEVTRRDKFLNPYMGKEYAPMTTIDGREFHGTEIISMGLEQLYVNPTGFAAADPGYFDFMMSILEKS